MNSDRFWGCKFKPLICQNVNNTYFATNKCIKYSQPQYSELDLPTMTENSCSSRVDTIPRDPIPRAASRRFRHVNRVKTENLIDCSTCADRWWCVELYSPTACGGNVPRLRACAVDIRRHGFTHAFMQRFLTSYKTITQHAVHLISRAPLFCSAIVALSND